MSVADKLNTYSKDYWDFTGYRSKSQLVRYPAIMVAPMQERILSEIIEDDNTIQNVLDPYFGSGTVLVEGKKLGLNVIGFDINPFAELITRVKLEGVQGDRITHSINELNMRITLMTGNIPSYKFANINKWFRADVIQSLSVLRSAIMGETDDRIRRFFWCCFGETVKRYSNTRTSTFKLHVKEDNRILGMVDDSIDFFRAHVQAQYMSLIVQEHENLYSDIRCGDSDILLKTLQPESIDLICTSPPYGDNQTTVTYGQFSILPLLWIDASDLTIWKDGLLGNFSAIDSASLGGKIKKTEGTSTEYEKFVRYITDNKRGKVIAFLEDYERVFMQLAIVLKPGKLMVLTLGNRRVDNQEIQFDRFNDMLAVKYGLEKDSTISRKISGKRMPSRVSYVNDKGPISSMNKEVVKVYRKVIINE